MIVEFFRMTRLVTNNTNKPCFIIRTTFVNFEKCKHKGRSKARLVSLGRNRIKLWGTEMNFSRGVRNCTTIGVYLRVFHNPSDSTVSTCLQWFMFLNSPLLSLLL